MKVPEKLLQAIEIFNELGWNTADINQAPILPLGTLKQQAIARRGLRHPFHKYFRKSPSINQLEAINPHMLSLFALRVGVDAKHAHELHFNQLHRITAACILQREQDFITKFVANAVHPFVGWEGNRLELDCSDIAAVLVVIDPSQQQFPIPLQKNYLELWAILAATALCGNVITSHANNSHLPTTAELTASFSQHAQAAIHAGVALDDVLGMVLVEAVARKLLDRAEVITWLLAAYDATAQLRIRRLIVKLLQLELNLSDSELLVYQEAIGIHCASADTCMLSAFGRRFLKIIDDNQLPDFAIGALYGPTLKARRDVLAALLDRTTVPRPSITVAFADRLAELAKDKDQTIRKRAVKLAQKWGVENQHAVAPISDNTKNTWQPTPKLWQVPRFERGLVTVESVLAVLSDMPKTNQFFDSNSELFLARLVELANNDLQAAKRALQGAGEIHGGVLKRWAKGEQNSLPHKWDRLPFVREIVVLGNIEKVPCLLSEPSFLDLSVDFNDLLFRLKQYQHAQLPVQESDLVLALLRLNLADININEAKQQIKDIEVAIMRPDGREVAHAVKTVTRGYLDNPYQEPQYPKLWELTVEARRKHISTPVSLRMFPDRVKQMFLDSNSPDPGCVPHWGDVAWIGLRPHDAGHGETVEIIAHMAACHQRPLSPGAVMNLLAATKSTPRGDSAKVREAVHLAWHRGLLRPSCADAALLHWEPELTNCKGIAEPLAELAREGLLSIVWPLLDDFLVLATKKRTMIPGTHEVAEAMQQLAPMVNHAIQIDIAPVQALEVPGLQRLASRGGSSKAVIAAKAALATLDVTDKPSEVIVTDEGADLHPMDSKRFSQLWPATALSGESWDYGVETRLGFGKQQHNNQQLFTFLTLANGTEYQVENLVTFGVVSHDDQWLVVSPSDSTANRFRICWTRLYAEDNMILVDPTGKRGYLQRGKRPEQVIPQFAVFALLAALADSQHYEDAVTALRAVIKQRRLGAAAVQASVAQLLQDNDLWRPARAVGFLATKPDLLFVLWPVLTESINHAAACLATEKRVPRWLNRVLDVTHDHASILLKAMQCGYIATKAWDGLTHIAAGKRHMQATMKAKQLVAAFGLPAEITR